MRFPFRIPARAHAGVQPPRPRRRWLRRRDSTRGQTMVEVGLVLPIFILTIVAVLEFGYFVAVASAVSTASREGARHGSTVDDSGGTPNYLDCDEIRDQARQLAGPLVDFSDAQIVVGYDTDEDAMGDIEVNCSGSVDEDGVERWDRMVVQVTHTWSPMTPLLELLISDRTLTSIDRRSIVKCDTC